MPVGSCWIIQGAFFSGSMLRRHCEILLCGKDAIFIVFVQKQMKCPVCCCVCLEPDLFFFGSFYNSKPLLTVGVACAVSSRGSCHFGSSGVHLGEAMSDSHSDEKQVRAGNPRMPPKAQRSPENNRESQIV